MGERVCLRGMGEKNENDRQPPDPVKRFEVGAYLRRRKRHLVACPAFSSRHSMIVRFQPFPEPRFAGPMLRYRMGAQEEVCVPWLRWRRLV